MATFVSPVGRPEPARDQFEPPSIVFQTPPASPATYTMLGLVGSTAMASIWPPSAGPPFEVGQQAASGLMSVTVTGDTAAPIAFGARVGGAGAVAANGAATGSASVAVAARRAETSALTNGAVRGRLMPPQSTKIGGCYGQDRKSTRLNSSHVKISYAVFCLKKK